MDGWRSLPRQPRGAFAGSCSASIGSTELCATLQHQAAHLSALSGRSLLIPVDIRRQRSSSSSSHSHAHSHAHTCTDSTHKHGPPSPSLQPPPEVDDRRKLIRAVAARKEGATRKAIGAAQAQSKFMQGPEPSWLRKKRDVEGGLKAVGGS